MFSFGNPSSDSRNRGNYGSVIGVVCGGRGGTQSYSSLTCKNTFLGTGRLPVIVMRRLKRLQDLIISQPQPQQLHSEE